MKSESTSKFEIFNTETAPKGSKPILENSIKEFGYIPNLHGVLALSPNLLEAYKALHKLFSSSSFNNDEVNVVWLTINVEHNCHYCVPAHTAIAKAMKVDQTIIEALRNQTPLPSEKLEVLRETTLVITGNRGYISESEIETFYNAGYDQRHLLEIILGLSQKVISNYVNHITNTPLDKYFEKFYWEPNQ